MRRETDPHYPFYFCAHEAAHAVARIVLDKTGALPRVYCIDMLPRYEWYELIGRMRPTAYCETASFDASHRWEDVVFKLAGPAADGRARRSSHVNVWFRHYQGSDFQDAIALLEEMGRRKDLECAYDEAASLVRKHWPAIEAVAEALQQNNGRLEGAAIEAIAAPFLAPVAVAA